MGVWRSIRRERVKLGVSREISLDTQRLGEPSGAAVDSPMAAWADDALCHGLGVHFSGPG